MSNVNAQATIRRLKRGGTETILLVSDVGDIIQDIIGINEGGAAIVAPDFTVAANQPSIYPVITVSIKDGVIVPADVKWYYNAAEITFNASDVSTGAFAGIFQKITRQSDGMPGLKIIKNLASFTNRDNDTIGFDGAIDAGGFSRRISKDYTILIQERAGDVRVGTISYPDEKNGVIHSQNDSVKLKVNLRQGAYVIPITDYTVKWKKLVGERWEVLKNEAGVEVTGHTITVTAGMVNSYQLIMVEFYDKNGQLITTDTAPVTDASDPLVIIPNPTPADETLINDDDTVKYAPKVVSRSDISIAFTGWTFSYALVDPAGKIFRTGSGSTFTVTVADSDAAGGGSVELNMTAKK